MPISPNDRCPCGSDAKYKRCCRPLHQGAPAKTPEALMRSRYSAYALNRAPYVIETTHPDGPLHRSDSTSWLRETEVFCEETRFEGLQVLDTARDDQTGDGWVTFHAQLSQRGRDVSFTERSRFVRHKKRWKYFDGKQR